MKKIVVTENIKIPQCLKGRVEIRLKSKSRRVKYIRRAKRRCALDVPQGPIQPSQSRDYDYSEIEKLRFG